MKVGELIKKLSEVSPDRTVFLVDGNTSYDFSGLSHDDNCDIQIYRVSDDREA